jgi:hypothetical protein
MIGIEQFEKHFIRNSESNNNILKTDVILDRIKTIKKLKIDLIENNIFHIKLLDYSESLFDLYYNYSIFALPQFWRPRQPPLSPRPCYGSGMY